jgi:signal transduction histidine kinase
LVESETKKEILKLESKLNKAENERKIYRLNAENEKAKLKLENTRLYYFIIAHVALVLLLLSISLWLYLRSQKRLAAQKELNYQQSISTFKTEKEIAVMQAMIDGEEHERKRIARELHDGIGSKLSALKILLSKQFQEDKPLTPEIKDQERIDTLLATSILEVRQISYNLVPESLLRFGLTKAVSDFCHLVSNDLVQVHFHANEISDSLSSSIQINVYRIVQELVNNALKHAKCNEITVSCSQNKNLLLITVDDNGIGFKLSKLSSISGQGIKNLQNRVDLFHGNIQFESDENGTSCHIELEIS